jgi:hypothetical protein
MQDPLTVLSLASNIIQFVNFSNKIIVASSQLYKSDYDESRYNRSSQIDPQAKSARWDSGTVSEDEQAFVSLYCSYNTLAGELLSRSLKAVGRYRKWKSLGQAIRTIWTEEEMPIFSQETPHSQRILGISRVSCVYL